MSKTLIKTLNEGDTLQNTQFYPITRSRVVVLAIVNEVESFQ